MNHDKMNVDQVTEQVLDQILVHEIWEEKLSATEPANYGIVYWEVSLAEKDVTVDVDAETFQFKKAVVNFSVRIGSIDDDDNVVTDFTRTATGNGTFYFQDGKNVRLAVIEVYFDLNL